MFATESRMHIAQAQEASAWSCFLGTYSDQLTSLPATSIKRVNPEVDT